MKHTSSSRRAAAVSLVITGMLVPALVSAQSASDLASQVQALLAQIAALQAQLGTASSQTGGTAHAAHVCPQLYRTIQRGASGTDVSSLQSFLGGESSAHYSAGVTGYFGPATELAVQNWQASHNVVSNGDPSTTGWGVVGSRTRAAIASACGSSPAPSQPTSCPLAPQPTESCSTGWRANTDANGCTLSYTCAVVLSSTTSTYSSNGSTSGAACPAIALQCPAGKHDVVGPNCSHTCVDDSATGSTSYGPLSASQTTGAAPLAVLFTGNGAYGNGLALTLDYGDGYTDTSVSSIGSFSRSHTYTQNGTYVARLYVSATGVTLSSARIVVGGTTSTTNTTGDFYTSPSYGSVPLTVSFYSQYGGTVEFGDGQSTMVPVPSCTTNSYGSTSCSFSQLTHTYQATGTYTARLSVPSGYACPGSTTISQSYVSGCTWQSAQTLTSTVVVSGASATSGTLSASATSGSIPLTVTFTGYVPNAGYAIDFGDGSVSGDVNCAHGSCPSGGPTSVNLTHTYTTAGTYTAKLYTHFTSNQGNCSTTDCNVVGSITIVAGGSSAVSLTTSISATTIQQGNGIAISWTTQNPPSGSAVGLWLQDGGGNIKGLIVGSRDTSGSYIWTVPGPQCNSSGQCLYQTDSPNVYYTTAGSYRILARLYTPYNAYLGGYTSGTPTYPTYIATAQSQALSIISQ